MGKDMVPPSQSLDVSEAGHAPLTAEAAVKAVKAGHAKDVDIAAQIIAEYGGDGAVTWTAEEEKRLIRRVDWRLVPIVSRHTRQHASGRRPSYTR